MRLPQFILENIEPILQEWEDFARSLSQGGRMAPLALRNDAESILLAAVRDMGTGQTITQQRSKSKGHGGAGGTECDSLDNASTMHGTARFGSGFNISEVVSEYRALRASVLRLWSESLPDPDPDDISDITRFNEAIDQSLGMAVNSFTEGLDRSRKMFLAILGHDLRNPLNSIRMSAYLAAARSSDDPESRYVMDGIGKSVQAISQLVMDLLDFAGVGLGAGMPVHKGHVDLGHLAREVLDETLTANPGRTIQFDASGNLICLCDATRLRQLMTNLLCNALEHGSHPSDVELSLTPRGPDIILTVRNQGPPIPPDLLPNLFDPMAGGRIDERDVLRRRGSLGLGLFIVREIVNAHEGTIEVTSSAESGTVFTVRLPHHLPSATPSTSVVDSGSAQPDPSLRK